MRNRSNLMRGDDGIGMVLVLAMTGVLTTLMVVTTTVALRSLESSRQHVSFEGALAVADGGIDAVLARAQQRYISAGADSYVTPAPGDATCDAPSVAWPWPSAQPAVADERTWAKQQLEVLAADADCRTSTASGEVVVLKPTGRQVAYAMAYSPRYEAAEVKRRLLKAEYLFMPYAPTHAILTSGDMLLDASTTVTSAPPNAPALAAVHSNGQVLVSSGQPIVYGTVSQSAPNPTATSSKFYGNPGGSVAPAPTQRIPFDGARSVWVKNSTSNPPGGWYDLCPDGTARTPDAGSPCAGSLLADVSGGGTFRGWRFDGTLAVPTWKATSAVKTSGYSGTYYVSEGDAVDIASNAGARVPNLTVLASAVGDPVTDDVSCNKVGGNISWGSIDPAAPSVPNTWLIADQDLLTSSNYQAGSASGGTVVSGFFIAGDQMQMSTSSNGAYGAVIAVDQCDPPDGTSLVDRNSIKNPSIYYDPNAKAPFTDVINNTLWLEFGV